MISYGVDQWAHPQHPLIDLARTHGLAVGHIHRYACTRIRLRGTPLYTTTQVSLDWVQDHKDLLNYVSSWCFIQSIT